MPVANSVMRCSVPSPAAGEASGGRGVLWKFAFLGLGILVFSTLDGVTSPSPLLFDSAQHLTPGFRPGSG